MNTSKSIIVLLSLYIVRCEGSSKIKCSKNEFRAIWIATVANIDWPTSNTDSVKKQQKIFIF
jgi:hypothetical protein